MSDVSLRALPVKLVHRIFDNLNVQTVLRSVRCVYKRLYAVANTYNRFELNCTSRSQSDIERICRVIQPDRFTSLILSKGDTKASSKINLFFSTFDIRLFTRIRSLTFRPSTLLFARMNTPCIAALKVHCRELYLYKNNCMHTEYLATTPSLTIHR